MIRLSINISTISEILILLFYLVFVYAQLRYKFNWSRSFWLKKGL